MKKVKQISVCLENVRGSLAHFSKCLADRNINILAISVAETVEMGVVRLVVDKPEVATQMIDECCPLTYAVRDVLLLDLPNEAGALAKAADKLASNRVNVEFVYGSASPDAKKPYVVMGVRNVDRAMSALRGRK